KRSGLQQIVFFKQRDWRSRALGDFNAAPPQTIGKWSFAPHHNVFLRGTLGDVHSQWKFPSPRELSGSDVKRIRNCRRVVRRETEGDEIRLCRLERRQMHFQIT